MAYWIYNLVIGALFVLMLPVLPFVRLRGRRLDGLAERLGFYPQPVRERLSGSRPVWIHAVSVGEVLAGALLIRGLKESFPEKEILLSTSTATGREIARKTAPAPEAVIYFPLDLPWVVVRSLRRFDPSLVIFLEKELWPNFLRLAHRRGVPVVLASGRLSPRSFRRYSLFRPLFTRALGYLSALGMQTPDDAERIARLGVSRDKIAVTGNLKQALSTDAAAGQNGKKHRPVLVAGSTHEGEEELLVKIFRSLKSRFPLLFMVLAPRHPHRFAAVEKLLQTEQVPYEKESRRDGDTGFDVLLLDTLGDLPRYYALADVAFVGGSLVDAGGHNLLEPARLGKPVVFGPYMGNFAEVAAEMTRRGGGLQVRNAEDLGRQIGALLAEPERASEMGRLAKSVAAEDREVLKRTLGVLARYL